VCKIGLRLISYNKNLGADNFKEIDKSAEASYSSDRTDSSQY
jgi:hypothetical protein